MYPLLFVLEKQRGGKKAKIEFDRIPKPFPGEHFKDQYPDSKDPRGEPSVIKISWNPDFRELAQCDTIHLLYLMQSALELSRKRVNERNKYFHSISRADRFIQHVDGPQIITKFIEWHNGDREHNVFNGEMVRNEKKVNLLNMMTAIGLFFEFMFFLNLDQNAV